MLIEFRVENHRSIHDEQVLTMEAGLPEDENDPRPRSVAGHSEKLLPVAALYGANASGKTNVLSALNFMREAVGLSHRSWPPDEGVPRTPFAWGQKFSEPSEYVVQILIEGVKYEYGFVANNSEFLEEWLFAWPNGRKQKWFERDGNNFEFGEGLRGDNKAIQNFTRSNSLFLSAAVQNKHEQLNSIHGFFRNIRPINVRSTVRESSYLLHTRIARMLQDDERPAINPDSQIDLGRKFRNLILDADIGIIDVKIIADDSSEKFKFPNFEFLHGTDSHAWLPLEEESKGTQTLFKIGSHLLSTIELGGTVIIDELESSLHPMLAAKIVREFNDPKTNPKNAQLIFTTHDTNLLGTTLGEPLMRRDQVWFTEKDKEGATVIYPLTDYKPRKGENLERGYLQGRYGAIPFLGDLHFGAEEAL